MLKKCFKLISHHKIITGLAMLVLLGGGYFGYQALRGDSQETKYVLSLVQKGTITSAVSGSGQVSVSNQVEVKAKVSGDVIYVGAVSGQAVGVGTLLVQLDARDAQRSVRDAEISLESAKLTLQKMKGSRGGEYVLRSVKEKAADDLKKSYDDGFNTVSNAFLDLPDIITGLKNLVFGTDFGGSTWNIDYYANSVKDYDQRTFSIKTGTADSYKTARQKFDSALTDYKSVSRFSEAPAIESIINESYDTTKAIAEAVKNANNLIQFYKDIYAQENLKPSSVAETHLATLSSYTDKTNKHLLSLLTAKNTIQNNKEAVAGSDLDISGQELTVKQKENSLLDAKEKLVDYFIRAPFSGVIAKVVPKIGEAVSANTSVVTLITQLKTAEISLNEVDVAKVKIGQKATLTFDAVGGLALTGQVLEIDTIGTVSQGVVTYNVKIGFDTQDERVKPGMSVSTNIITDVRPDVLTVPNSAVKTQGNVHYVEVPANTEKFDPVSGAFGVPFNFPVERREVETGVSNDESTEIISGLNESNTIVVRTITASSNTTSQQSQGRSLFPVPGQRGGGSGGGFRSPAR